MNNTLPWLQPERVAQLNDALVQRILIIDGAMGTMLQAHELDEHGYRGSRFADGHDALQAHDHAAGCAHDLKGNNDLLSLSQPDLIRDVHLEYLRAGADMVETNSLSPDVNNPGFRNIDFDELADAYSEATHGLIEGGADVIMIETIFDTLNAKSALMGIARVFDEVGGRLPLMISGTITDRSGRTLSGQTAEAFWYSLSHAQPLSIGLNCALGAKDLREHIESLARVADCRISTHPNAGLPNAFGGYDETPEDMARTLGEFAQSGLLNLVGGCCGTTPAHIGAIAAAVSNFKPRALPAHNRVAA